MDRLAFKSTHSVAADAMLERVEALGGNIQCASSREAMMYQAATFNNAIEDATGLLAETIRNPRITEEEVQEQLLTAEYEIGEIWSKPELILPELIHTAGFKGNTLGNPLLCPKERLGLINRNTVLKYRDLFYRPERMVVAFAGVAHKDAVALAEKFFGDMPGTAVEERTGSETSEDTDSEKSFSSGTSTSSQLPGQTMTSKIINNIPFFKNISTSASAARNATPSPVPTLNGSQPAHYTGGFLTLPHAQPSPNPALPTFSHIQLAFEGLPISSPDIYALATLQTLLGGGGSFSAGGPGKGMYSRLYTNVLNQHGWVESCMAYNHSYADSGLFGIAASCDPRRVADMLDVMCIQLRDLTSTTGFRGLRSVEVARAKNQLRSSLLMNLESRMVELEDLGRQVQVHGRKIPVRDMCDKIEALTIEDLARVASLVVKGEVGSVGGGSGAPTVVLQEAEVPWATIEYQTWSVLQDRIAAWGLGRRQ